MTKEDTKQFIDGFITAAIWSSIDDDGLLHIG